MIVNSTASKLILSMANVQARSNTLVLGSSNLEIIAALLAQRAPSAPLVLIEHDGANNRKLAAMAANHASVFIEKDTAEHAVHAVALESPGIADLVLSLVPISNPEYLADLNLALSERGTAIVLQTMPLVQSAMATKLDVRRVEYVLANAPPVLVYECRRKPVAVYARNASPGCGSLLSPEPSPGRT